MISFRDHTNLYHRPISSLTISPEGNVGTAAQQGVFSHTDAGEALQRGTSRHGGANQSAPGCRVSTNRQVLGALGLHQVHCLLKLSHT